MKRGFITVIIIIVVIVIMALNAAASFYLQSYQHL